MKKKNNKAALDRREFIGSVGKSMAALLLAQLSPFRLGSLLADEAMPEAPNHFLVLIDIYGGLDVTLGLDPQVLRKNATEKDMFVEYQESEIIDASGVKLAPAAKALKDHMQDIAIINGIQMTQDAGHESLKNYIASGDGSGSQAILPVELASTRGSGPFGLLASGSVSKVQVGGRDIIITRSSEILDASNSSSIEILKELLKKNKSNVKTELQQAQEKLVASESMVEALAKYLEEMKKNLERGKKISDAQVIAASFLSGVSQFSIYEPTIANLGGQGIDSHSDHPKNHLAAQTFFWEKVAELFKLFKSIPYLDKSLFDYTTFMTLSEFSRTPALNSSNGKDHNPYTNSVIVAGYGIQGGQTIGESRLVTRKKSLDGMPYHMAAPFDFSTGKAVNTKDNASFIYPENVIKTLASIYGENTDDLQSVSKKTKIIPGLLKKP